MSKERFLTVMIPIKDSDCEPTVYADASALATAVPPSEDNINKVYKLQDGTYMRVWLNTSTSRYEYHAVTDREFPYLGNPIEIFDFTYDATRMGTAPTISAQGVMRYADADGTTLDGLWTQQCHVSFNGKRLYLKRVPTSSKSDEDARYKYDMDFVDERVVLEQVYIYDVVSPFVYGKPISESSTFSFYGDINDLAKRINASLLRSGLASLSRKYVGYPAGTPSKAVPYLTYEQWNSMLVNPLPLIGVVFDDVPEMVNFRIQVYLPLNGNYSSYLAAYIYENTNGDYVLTGYQCKIGTDKYGSPTTSEEKLIVFENNTIHEALQQFHDTFELVYYITCEKDSSGNFTGNTWIMVADCEHDFADIDPSTGDFVRDADGIPISTNPIEYGSTEALLSKEKTNTTDKIVTRITGVGSAENIPWYYPNPSPDGWIKPLFTRDGAEMQGVTIDYPTDEGSTVASSVRYEKFLRNRLGVPIKKGIIKQLIYKNEYKACNTEWQTAPNTPPMLLIHTIYNIDVSDFGLWTTPRITLEMSYDTTSSGISKVTSRLARGNTEVGTYDSSQTYQDPTDFQSMFIDADGKHKQNLAEGTNYFLDTVYHIPGSLIPVSEDFDYEGYKYESHTYNFTDSSGNHPPQSYTDYDGTVHNYTGYYTAYLGSDFYSEEGLIPFVKWNEVVTYNGVYEAYLHTISAVVGYSTDGTINGKVSPIPRRSQKQYKDLSDGTIYKCTTSSSHPIDTYKEGLINPFNSNPLQDEYEWLRRYVYNFTIRLYANDGWYLKGEKIILADYGLGEPSRSGNTIITDIFDVIEFQRLKWVTPQPNLMPEVFIKTDGERRFYNAHNYYPLQVGTADTAIGEEQVGFDVRNPIYKEEETDPDDKHYDFESEYRQGTPHEHIENFDDVKPTIEGQTNVVNGVTLRIDVVETFDYDTTDNNEKWDGNEEETIQGDYKHPYFFAKLRPMGFNIFDLATTDDMVLSMTTGDCGACNFKIGVDENTGKNPVQVWEYDVYKGDTLATATKIYEAGELRRYIDMTGLYYNTDDTQGGYVPVTGNMLIEDGGLQDANSDLYDRYMYSEESVKKGLVGGVKQDGKKHFEGDVVTNGRFIESQQDTSENYVWVALMKDTESYGVIMPSSIPNYNDPTLNQYIEPKGIEYTDRATGQTSVLTEEQADKFVLTNIRLPQIYLRRAERKLSRELVKYMYEHNWQRFNFSIKFSRIYIEENPSTDDDMNENSVLYVMFSGTVYRQYAKHYSYRMARVLPLPETNVDMNEDLSVSRTMTQQWDGKLAKSGRATVSYVGKVNDQTRDLAQKHYKGKNDDLSSQGSTSGSGGTSPGNTYITYGLEWGEF